MTKEPRQTVHDAPFRPENSALLTARAAQREQDKAATAAMARYVAGEERAFDEVYAFLSPRLYRLCVRLVGAMDAPDLLQEVFLKIHRARASFLHDKSVFAWASAIARTTCIDLQRGRLRRPESAVEPSTLELHATGAEGDPAAPIAMRTLTRALETTFEAMSESLRTAYVLMKIEGLDSNQIGSMLGISPVAVRQRSARACHELRKAIGRAESSAA